MRAKNAGTRRSVKKVLTEKQNAPRGRPFQKKHSEYENQPERYPGLHVCISPLEAPRDINAPTVGTLIADGYHQIETPSDFPIPDGHALMGISAEIFGRRQEAMIAEAHALLNPEGQPQSEEEMKRVINNKMTPGQYGAAGRADALRTHQPISLNQAEAVLAQNQRASTEPVQTDYFNDTE